MFQVPSDGARKNDFFEIAAFLHEVLEGIAVGDSDNVLLDNGAVVQDFRNVMSGCADQLDAALERLVVRLRADKGRQKRMMDVDDALRVAPR